MLVVGERVAGARVAHAHRRVDVARVADLDLLALVRVHAQDAAEALALAARGVHHGGAGLRRPRVDAEEGEVAVRVVLDLERERGEGLLVARLALDGLVLLARVDALDGLHVRRGGQQVHDRVEEHLDALVLERGAAEHGDELEAERPFAERGVDLLARDVRGAAGDELLHDLVARVGGGLDHRLPEVLAAIEEGLHAARLVRRGSGRLVGVDVLRDGRAR